MKKVSLLIFSLALGFSPVASAAGTTTGHNVRQYVQNRVSHFDRKACMARHGKIIKSHNELKCVYPKK